MADKSLWSWRNAGGQLLDAFIPGNAYNPYRGKFNPTTAKVGVAGAVAGQFVPGGEKLVQGMANKGMFGQGTADRLQYERLGDIASKGIWQEGKTLSGMLRDQTRNSQFQWAPNAVSQPAMTGGGSLAQMAAGGGNRSLQPNLTPNNWQQSVWDQNLQQMQGRMDERLAAGGNAGPAQQGRYDASIAAMGGRSQGGANGMGWTGVGGQQTREQFLAGGYQGAQGVYSGMRSASDAAIRQSEYDNWVRGQRT